MANVKATDLIDFTRASNGYALAKVSYGSELVENGTFDTDSDWDVQSYWSIADGKATKSPGSSRLKQELNVSAGTVYQITLTVTHRAGSLTVSLGGDALPVIDSSGTFNLIAVCGSSTSLLDLHGGGTTDCDVDNVSVKEVLFSQPDGSLQLFEHPNNIPRIEYDADGNLLGLLIEEARTNLITQSNSASALSTSSVVSATDSTEITSPTGSGTVIKLNKTASGYGYSRFSYSSTTDTQTFSVFVKKGTARYVGLRTLASGGTHTTFDLDTGAFVVTAGSADRTAVEVGNGWYRLSITNSAASSWASVAITDATGSELNDETGTAYVFGYQRELGSFPTSYINTTGSTASRSADVASIDVDQFGYNQSEGTVTVEATMLSSSVSTSSASQAYFGFFKTDQLNRLEAYSDSSSTITVRDRVAGTNNDATLSSVTLTDTNKLAVAFESGAKTAAVLNGGSVSETSSTTNNAAYETLILGDTQNVDAELNGHIKSITYTPKRLSNAKLQELTS